VIGLLCSLGSCLAINAIFYGVTFETPTAESATTIFVTIVAAVVPVLAKLFFKKHKQVTYTSEKERYLKEKNQKLKCINYWVGCYCLVCFCSGYMERRRRKKRERKQQKVNQLLTFVMHDESLRKDVAKTKSGSPVKKITRSFKRTFSKHDYESAYGFDDLVFERQRDVLRIQEKAEALQDIFDYRGKDGREMIARDELVEAIQAKGLVCDDEDVNYLMKMIDINDDGGISFEEFRKVLEG